MSKRKLDELENGDQICCKIVKQNLAEEKEISGEFRNGDQPHFPSLLNSECFTAEANKTKELYPNDTENGSNNHLPLDLPPAKRISKRSVKKNLKLKREKSRAVVHPEILNEDEQSKSKRRTWERWSKEDTYIFFEGLNEFGKDFDKLQSHFKAKYRNKKNFPDNYIKNKDQIRHFYYRTWHKISSHINFEKELKNNTKELNGLINYGELWKKVGGTIDDKFGAKLDEIVQKGSATVKIKGKTLRIKTPVCRALKKLHNKEDQAIKSKNKSKLPSKVVLIVRPHTTNDWCRVQKIAQNPHVKINVGIHRKLQSVITCLDKKWRSHDEKIKESMFGSNQQSESPENNPDTKESENSHFLLLPPKGVIIKPKPGGKVDGEKAKRPKIKIKLTGFDNLYNSEHHLELPSHEKICDNVDENDGKFEEMLSMQRKKVDNENGVDDDSNDVVNDGLESSPKQGEDSPKQDDIPENNDDDDNDYILEESDQECSRSPTHNDETLDNNEDGSETETKDDDEELKADILEEIKDEEDDAKVELEEDIKSESSNFNPEEGWSLDTVGSLTIGDLYTMFNNSDCICTGDKITLEYTWRRMKTEPLTDMLSRLVKLAASVGRGGLGARGRNNSTSSGGGSPSVRAISSPVTSGKTLVRNGAMSPVGRGLGFGGAAKQIILPGGNGVDKPDSPLAVPLEPSEHEFRKPLLPPAPVRQGAMSAAFKEQIGQYLPKWSNRAGRQRRSRVKQVVGRHILQTNIQPRPAPNQVVQIINGLVTQPSTSGAAHAQVVQVLPLPIVDSMDSTSITLIPATVETNDSGEEPSDNVIINNDVQEPELTSPPQISIPEDSRRSPSPTPSFSTFMDMSFDSVGQKTPTKNQDQFLTMYHDGDSSLLQTPPRPAPSPCPSFSQDLSISSWSLNFDSPLKNLSLPFNEDSQNSTISTVSEVDRQITAMMCENSIDFTSKFAKLAKHVDSTDPDHS